MDDISSTFPVYFSLYVLDCPFSTTATKGNSGIVHAGYDDKPGTNRAKYCWKGNQMFADLDRELRFGYQKNGSLVIAFSEEDKKQLQELKKRGETNGVKNLSILTKKELFAREPHVHPDAVGALYSPDAGNVIPYEYTIALAENAVDNGVELRIRREVQAIDFADNVFTVKVQHWEPKEFIDAVSSLSTLVAPILFGCTTAAISYFMLGAIGMFPLELKNYHIAIMALLSVASRVLPRMLGGKSPVTKNTPLKDLALQASLPEGKGKKHSVSVEEMLVGGSGSLAVMKGEVVAQEVVRARYVINCAGGASDQIARMIGDDSFKIKPRVGDYLLLNRNQVRTRVWSVEGPHRPFFGNPALTHSVSGRVILPSIRCFPVLVSSYSRCHCCYNASLTDSNVSSH